MAVNSALADLLTQAPETDEGQNPAWSAKQAPPQNSQKQAQPQQQQPVPQQQQKTEPAGKGWLFRCFRKGKDSKPNKKNLSAVVPVQEETSTAAPSVQAKPKAQAQKSHETEAASGSQKRESQNGQKDHSSGVNGTKESKDTKENATKKTSEEQAMAKPKSGPSSSSAAGKQAPAESSSRRQEEDTKGLKEGHIKTVTCPGGEPPQLGPQTGPNIGRKTLVLDLDETLVHSSFRTVQNADIVISVEIEGENHAVFVRKRPGCDEFLLRVAQLYEVVVYTASMSKYANPLLDMLDPKGVCTWRLFREACTRLSAGYVKDLSRLGRDSNHVIIIDNSPVCYSLQPNNAIPIQTWRDDPDDRELLDLLPILISLADVEDIPMVLQQIVWGGEDIEAIDEHG